MIRNETQAHAIETIEDLKVAAIAAGITPSELIAQAWPRHAPSGRGG